MCKRQAGEKLLEEEKGLEGIIDDIGEDHAKLILDRLELLSKLREIVKHPKLEERLKLCENNLDTPDWWESGKHDRELIKAVLKHGLYRSDQLILNDPDFPFMEAEKRYVKNLEVLKSFKFDNPAELFKLAMGEVPMPPKEKPKDATPKESQEKEKIEEVKEKEPEEQKTTEEVKYIEEDKKSEDVSDPKSPENVEQKPEETEVKPAEDKEESEAVPKVEESTEDKAEEKMEVDELPTEKPEESIEEKSDEEKMEVDEPKILENPEIESNEKEVMSKIEEEEKSEPVIEEAKGEEVCEKPISPEAEKVEEKKEEAVEIKQEPIERPEGEPKIVDTVVIDDDDTLTEKPESSEKKSEQRFPDLEIFKPLMQMKQFDAMLKGDVKDNLKALSRIFDTSMIVKWFREFALEKRISHIIYCVEKGIWPVGKSYSAYSGCLGIDLDLPLYETVKRLNADKRSSSSTPDVITITTDHHQLSKSVLSSQLQAQMQSMSDKSKKAQKRHIAIDVETERAKLHALLNNTGPLGATATKSSWNEDDHDLRRASGSSGSSLQPPPAHQHVSRSSVNSQYKPSVTIPGTSSTLTPIDLSSR